MGLSTVPPPTLAGLFQLHEAHVATVPYENIEPLLGRPPALDFETLESKIILQRRGGYCFECNSLFRRLLQDMGFDVKVYVGRMHFGRPTPGPRSHMILDVLVDDVHWLVDVGFSGLGFVTPLPLVAHVVSRQFGDEYRLVPKPRVGLVLQRRAFDESLNGDQGEADGDGTLWLDLYSFVPEEAFELDIVQGNHFTATHEKSPFLHHPMFGHTTRTHRFFIRSSTLIVGHPGAKSEYIPMESAEAIVAAAESYGVPFADPDDRHKLTTKIAALWPGLK